ncbi:MAG: hypothetical protein WC345_10135 [Smithellaceae bacterium]|jgi:hypothetical protein|nr:hypothetical protein [Smithellaceae bacterium]HOC61178.1 hypothetical protein [Smithellaceae bacterium]
MATIYKNTDESSWSKYVLCISFPENIHQQINEWEANLDKMVFDEQIKTGSYHGRVPVRDNIREHMKGLKEKGIVRPYYGATGAQACSYFLQVTPPTCVICVEHTMAGEKVSFEDSAEIIQINAAENTHHIKNSFMVRKQEYRNLQKWKYWNEKEEFTSRYIYKFFSTSIGLVITVTDTHTKDKIDISDYENW